MIKITFWGGGFTLVGEGAGVGVNSKVGVAVGVEDGTPGVWESEIVATVVPTTTRAILVVGEAGIGEGRTGNVAGWLVVV